MLSTTHYRLVEKILKRIKVRDVVENRNYTRTAIREPAAMIQGKMPKFVDADKAHECFECLKSNMTVYASGAAATPVMLLKFMTEAGKKKKVKNVKVCHMHTEGDAPYTAKDCKGIFRSCSFFMGGNVRKGVAEGRSDAIPLFLSDIPKLFSKKIIKPDFAVVTLSAPDEHGYCSSGTSCDCVRSAMQHAKIIVAQINQKMPRCFGDGIVHLSQLDYVVCIDQKLPVLKEKPMSEEEKKIGKYIAENLVEDGATLQMGIGAIPDAVLAALDKHKDLGIHSEMFASGVIKLVENGNLTNRKKSYYAGRIVSSFLIGTQKLYDFVNNQPFLEMLAVDYVNDTNVIAKQSKMTAINSCIEVDLTGQVCSDSIGTRMYSGFGGQVDFIRGAAKGRDGKGKPILAMVSQTRKGQSKIVPILKPGAGVVTTRAHVHYLVTEYGIAELFGKTLRQRAHALIKVAHPKHREALEKAAYERLKCKPAP